MAYTGEWVFQGDFSSQKARDVLRVCLQAARAAAPDGIDQDQGGCEEDWALGEGR